MSRLEWTACFLVFAFSLVIAFRNPGRLEPLTAYGAVPSRGQIEARAVRHAKNFGVDVAGWGSAITASRDGDLRFAYQNDLVEDLWRLRTPYFLTVTFHGPSHRLFRVRMDSSGELGGVSIRDDAETSPAKPAKPQAGTSAEELQRARELAIDAFANRWQSPGAAVGGVDLGFRLTADTVEREDGILFEWTSDADPAGMLAWRVECLVRDREIARLDVAPLKLEPLRDRKRQSEAFVETGAFLIIALGMIGFVSACGFTIVNLFRRRLPWWFFVRSLAVVAVVALLDPLIGSQGRQRGWQWYLDFQQLLSYVFLVLFATAATGTLLGAGRSVRTASDFGRWVGLEDFLRFQWAKASVVRSVWRAGLIAVWLLPLPILVSAAIPGILLDSPNRNYLGLAFPFYASIPTINSITVLFVVAFAIPLANAIRRPSFLRRPIAFAAASLGVAPFLLVDAPGLAVAAAAILTAAILVYGYFRFGVLAAILGGLLAHPLLQAVTLSVVGDVALQSWGFAFLAGTALVATVCVVLDLRNPAREREQELSEEEFAALKRESEREIVSRRERLLGEFALAQQAQQRMLPNNPPYVEGFEIAAICKPAQQVGGDLFDYIRLNDARWACCVADVSGKGVSASLYMTMIKGLLNALSLERADLLEIVTILNQHVYQVIHHRSFVTMSLAAINSETREIEVMRAGHLPMLHVGEDGVPSFVESKGIGLGLVPSSAFCRNLNSATVRMKPGDVAVLYSDGVTEAMNRSREEFGEERFAAVVASCMAAPAIEIRDRVMDEIQRFQAGAEVHDDITVLVLKALPRNGDSPPARGMARPIG